MAALLSHGASRPCRQLVIHPVARQLAIALELVAGPDAPVSPAIPVARTGVMRLTPEREPCESGETYADHRGRHRVGADVLNRLSVGDVMETLASRILHAVDGIRRQRRRLQPILDGIDCLGEILAGLLDLRANLARARISRGLGVEAVDAVTRGRDGARSVSAKDPTRSRSSRDSRPLMSSSIGVPIRSRSTLVFWSAMWRSPSGFQWSAWARDLRGSGSRAPC